MAVSVDSRFFGRQQPIHITGFFEYNLQAEESQFQDISAIFNLTSWPPSAILLLDYPMDNHASRIEEGIAYDRDP